MKSTLRAAALTTTCLWALPSFADVTPEDVWASYRGMMTSMGMEVTAEETREGDTLIVRNVVYDMKLGMPMGDATSSSTISELRFEQRRKGTVAVEMPEPVIAVVKVPGEPDLGMPGYETRTEMIFTGQAIVSGTPQNMVYTFDDAALTAKSKAVFTDGEMVQPATQVSMTGVSGDYNVVEKETSWSFDMDMTAKAVTYQLEPFEADEAGLLSVMEYRNLKGKGNTTFPKSEESDMFSALFESGEMDVTFSAESSTANIEYKSLEADEAMNFSGSSGPGALVVKLSDGVLSYDTEAKDIALTVAGPQIPGGALDFGLKGYGGGVTFPMGAGEGQPFRVKIGMQDLSLPDFVWTIVDPTEQMPHDPANIRLEVNGTMDNETAFYDFAQLMEMESAETPPFMPKTISLPEFFISVAGASVAAQGEGTFLIEDMATSFVGEPPFAGKLSVNLKGVQTLLNTLTSSGLLPQESVMSAQMMFAMFARPGEGEDELISELEMTKDGQMIANGQPLPF